MAEWSEADELDAPPPSTENLGIGVAGGAVVGVSAVVAAAVLVPDSPARLVVVAGAVGVYAAMVGDRRAGLVTAGLAYLLFDGFLVNRHGALGWDGATSVWHLVGFALALLLGFGYRLARAAWDRVEDDAPGFGSSIRDGAAASGTLIR